MEYFLFRTRVRIRITPRFAMNHSDECQLHSVIAIAVGEMSTTAERQHRRNALEKLRALLDARRAVTIC